MSPNTNRLRRFAAGESALLTSHVMMYPDSLIRRFPFRTRLIVDRFAMTSPVFRLNGRNRVGTWSFHGEMAEISPGVHLVEQKEELARRTPEPRDVLVPEHVRVDELLASR